jgi:Cys-tRNA(Pro)/Cys-tRNA(Cys) deacylase
MSAMSRTTPATVALGKLGIYFELRVYDRNAAGPRTGLQAAVILGEPPHLVLKTLLQVDGRPVCVLAPSDRQVSMKKFAAAFGSKTAKMMAAHDVERQTGYRVGAVSPFGQET